MSRRSRIATALWACAASASILAGCTGGESTPADAGPEPADAGTEPPDAASEPADAGTEPPDAGTEPPDAGTEPPDAGTERIAGLTEGEYEQWVHSYCDHVCEEMDAACSGDAWQLEHEGRPFDLERCHAECDERLWDDPRLIANYHCHAPTCEEQWACVDAEPLPVPDECIGYCEAIGRCGMMDLLESRGSRETCEYLCAGGIPHSGFGERARCVTDALAGECDVLGALECIPFVQWQCQHVCGPIDDSHSHGEGCEGPSGYDELWSDAEACLADCLELSYADAVAAEACFEANACGDVTGCWPPAARDPACEGYCRDLLAACPGFAYPEQTLCEGWCSEAAARTEGWPECAEPVTGCPDDPVDLLWCPVSEPALGCEAMCRTLVGCEGGDETRCLAQCSSWAESNPVEHEAARTCLEEASNCDAVSACIDG